MADGGGDPLPGGADPALVAGGAEMVLAGEGEEALGAAVGAMMAGRSTEEAKRMRFDGIEVQAPRASLRKLERRERGDWQFLHRIMMKINTMGRDRKKKHLRSTPLIPKISAQPLAPQDLRCLKISQLPMPHRKGLPPVKGISTFR